ncbi:MAG: NADP-dependent phosphogluconate dehydrogenase [Myxococcota bacterium]
MAAQANFGVVGLGVMGANLAMNFADHGARVAVWNLERDKQEKFLAEHPGFVDAKDLAALVAAIEKPRRILVMVTAGKAVDSVAENLSQFLEKGDVIIDGGNSLYTDTRRREQAMAAKGLRFVGMGVSGGEEGARHGPSLMPGGAREAYEHLKPLLESVAAKTESGPCVTYCGPDGAGHFTKMVHNGIEYADMQLIAGAYDVLRRGIGLDNDAIADVFAKWNEGPLQSFLIEITAKIFRVRDGDTKKHLVDVVLDQAGQKGTGRWTVEAALEVGVAIPSIAAALDARVISSQKDARVALAKSFDEPARASVSASDRAVRIAEVHDGLLAAKICAYAQGMELIHAASQAYKWDIDRKEVARIWKGGCIIRARLLDTIMQAFGKQKDLRNLIADASLGGDVRKAAPAWRELLARSMREGIAMPAFAASLTWFDGVRSPDLPQNLTQAQRDAFGAHTYIRRDNVKSGPVHSEWLKE